MSFSEHHEINKLPCLRRALFALHGLDKPSSPAEVARHINGATPHHWAGPGASKFFRIHFAGGKSPYFSRELVVGGSKPRYVYQLTELGKELAKDIQL